MNFAIRNAMTKEFVAVIPIRAKRNDEELAVAMLWDEIDAQESPWNFEYVRLSNVLSASGRGHWKEPAGEWKTFDKGANDYYAILEGKPTDGS